jgi:hypothetical protein
MLLTGDDTSPVSYLSGQLACSCFMMIIIRAANRLSLQVDQRRMKTAASQLCRRWRSDFGFRCQPVVHIVPWLAAAYLVSMIGSNLDLLDLLFSCFASRRRFALADWARSASVVRHWRGWIVARAIGTDGPT